MKICLDTNAYAAFKRSVPPLKELLESAEEVFVPTIVLGELYAGFQMGSKTQQNIQELKEFLESPGVSVLSMTHEIAERYGRLIKILKDNGTPLPVHDIWIAAATFESGARLVTYDGHFNKIPGLVIYSP